MKAEEIFNYSLKNLKHRGLRSYLTILGIVIGIAAIFVMISLGDGLKKSAEDQMNLFGPEILIVYPVNIEKAGGMSYGAGAMFRATHGRLTISDFNALSRLKGIDVITKAVIGRISAKYKDSELSVSIFGIEPKAFKSSAKSLEIEKGRYLQEGDRGKIIIGNDIAYSTFKKGLKNYHLKVGDRISLEGRDFTIVGIAKKTGNSMAPFDTTIFIPYDDARDLLGNMIAKNEISAIRIVAKDKSLVKDLSEEIKRVLRSKHKVKEGEENFSVITAEFISQQVDKTLGIITVFFFVIAAISLIVGGIGIANSMFASVIERRKEIGILKSIGATPKEIEYLFLTEAAMLSIIGGILGVFLGSLIILGASNFLDQLRISPVLVLESLCFSIIIGILSGISPAKEAARLNPVDALTVEV